MAYELVVSTLWHAPANLNGSELAILLAIAEITRAPGIECVCTAEELAQCARISPDAVQKALRRLSVKGVDVRVPIRNDKNGRPVYAHSGRASQYRLPLFPAPAGCLCSDCRRLRQVEGLTVEKGGISSALPGDPPDGEGRTTVRPSEEKGGISSAEGRNRVRERADSDPPHPVAGSPVAAAVAAPAPLTTDDPHIRSVAGRLGIDTEAAETIVTAVKRKRAPENLGRYLTAIPDDELRNFLRPKKPRNGKRLAVLPPCGQCDAQPGDPIGMRLVQVAGGGLAKCPRCNPYAEAVTRHAS